MLNKMNTKLNKIKLALQKLIAESFASVSTDKGILSWDGENELPAVGDAVYSLDEEGNQIAVEDGEYVTETVIIVVVDGKVAEIRDRVENPENEEPAEPAEEEVPAEEPADNPENIEGEAEEEVEAPAEAEADPRDERIAQLEAELAEREARIAELEARSAELENKPAAESAEEEFKSQNKIEKTGNRKLDNLARILNA